MKLLKDILFGVDLLHIQGNSNTAIADLVSDSRKVGSMSCFVAVPGVTSDGHLFIATAIEQGAAVVVCERLEFDFPPHIVVVQVKSTSQALGIMADNFFENPSSSLKVIGITGTNGKTTCATLMFDLFSQLGEKCGLFSTVEIRIGREKEVATHTTPDAMVLHGTFKRMLDAGVKYVFMEVSSHAMVQNRCSGVRFAGGVFTNISRDHLDYHGTFKAYIEAKKSFFDQLPSKAFAISNLDDSNGVVMLQNCKADKTFYSMRSLTDYHGKVLESSFSGCQFRFNNHDFMSPLVGKFNAYNLLAVFGVGIQLGYDEMTLLTAMSLLKPVQGRFQYFQTKTGVTAIVDYAHTPDALENVLKTIQEIRTGNETIFTVVGCGGDRDKGKRPQMARIAGEHSDRVILTTDNPRFENPDEILNDMQAGIEAHQYSKFLTISSRKEAIKAACMSAQKSDIILVAGKGHEAYQEIEGVRHHFNDLEELRSTFEILGAL